MTRLIISYKTILLILFLPIFYGWLRYIPNLSWVFNLTLVFIIFLFLSFYRGSRHKIFNNLNLYIFLMMTVVPILGSLSAFHFYNQPIFYGLASNRYLILLLFNLVLIQLLIKGRLDITHLQSSFVFLAWFSVFLFSFINFYVDPNELDVEKFGNYVFDGGGTNNKLNLPKGFIVFGLFYYFCKSINPLQRSGFNTIAFIFFLTYLFSTSISRVLFMSIFLGLIFLIINFDRKNTYKKLQNLMKFFLVIIFLSIAIIIFNPEYFSVFFSKYIDAFRAIGGADEVDDWSANARIQQLLIVAPIILENIFFGAGTLSNQWMGGYEEVFGYLHPSDLGLIGIIFQIGIVGLSFLLIQYYIAFSVIKNFLKVTDKIKFKEFYMTMMTVLILNCLSSITTGAILYGPETILLAIFVLKYGILMHTKEQHS